MIKNLAGVISVAVFLCLLSICAFTQTSPAQENKEPELKPLTAEEQKINPRSLIENQPDFVADEGYFSARAISGFSSGSKVARKGKKYLVDTGAVVVITEPSKPILRLYQDKTFESIPFNGNIRVSSSTPLNPTDLLAFPDISFTSLGTIEIDGNKCLKIEAKSKQFAQQVFLYSAFNLKNLITVVQVIGPERSGIQRLGNISFDVPDNLFDISGHSEMVKRKWTKIPNAKVYFDEEHVKDGIVFRFDEFLFVHAGEYKHFLIDLNKRSSGTAYRGLLLDNQGIVAWQSEENEAFSNGEFGNYAKSDCKKCPKVEIGKNHIVFPDSMYDHNEILIKVTW